MRPILLIMWTAFQSFILRHNNNNNNNNNKSFIYTGDIYQHYTMLVLTRCPVNKIYNNIILNYISKTLKTAKVRLLKTANLIGAPNVNFRKISVRKTI